MQAPAAAVGQHGGRQREVGVGAVDRRSRADLAHRRPGQLLHRDDVARARRFRDERDERRQVDLLLLVEVAGRAGGQFGEVVPAALFLEPRPRLLVGRKDGAGRAELGDHVRDRPALGERERLYPGTVELEDASPAPANAPAPQQLEDDVLRLDPRPRELVLEVDADDLRTRELERVPGHADGHVQPAGPDRDHGARARLRRVAVRADQGLPGHREALAVDVMADAVPGAREPGAVLRRHRLQEPMVVGILEVDLEDVVVDVDDRCLHLDALDLEELELHHRHRPGGVLGECLVDAEPDLGARDELAPDEVLLQDAAG